MAHRRDCVRRTFRPQFRRGNHNHPPSSRAAINPKRQFSFGEPCHAAHGVTIINAAILRRSAQLRRHARAVGELRLHQLGIDRARQRRALRDRGDPARDLDPLDENRRRIVKRRIHRIWTAGGKPLPIDPAQHPFPGQPAIGQLSRQRAVAEDITCPARVRAIAAANRRAMRICCGGAMPSSAIASPWRAVTIMVSVSTASVIDGWGIVLGRGGDCGEQSRHSEHGGAAQRARAGYANS